MRRTLFTPFTSLAAIIALVIAALLSAPTLFAQGTPAAGENGVPPHPAHIHSGTCAELGDVVYPLNDVTPLSVDVAPNATPKTGDVTPEPEAGVTGTPVEGSIAGEGQVVAESTTIVEASLADLMGEEHAINIHESADNIGNYIACGDLIGEQTDETLLIDLQPLNDSGYSGNAALTDNADGTTTVTITLTEGTDGATPAATPSS